MGEIDPVDRDERRRQSRLSSMRATMRAFDGELARIGTLGNDDASLALHELSIGLLLEATRAQLLQLQFARLAARDGDEFDAACNDAFEREREARR